MALDRMNTKFQFRSSTLVDLMREKPGPKFSCGGPDGVPYYLLCGWLLPGFVRDAGKYCSFGSFAICDGKIQSQGAMVSPISLLAWKKGADCSPCLSEEYHHERARTQTYSTPVAEVRELKHQRTYWSIAWRRCCRWRHGVFLTRSLEQIAAGT